MVAKGVNSSLSLEGNIWVRKEGCQERRGLRLQVKESTYRKAEMTMRDATQERGEQGPLNSRNPVL